MKDIADAAGVSVATVSKVLNGLDQHISGETRQRVLKAVDSSGYVPNAVARGLKMNRSRMLGFILPDITNPFFPQVAKGIEDAARGRGFGVIIGNTNDTASSELEVMRFLSSRMVDGIVIARALHSANMERCLTGSVPAVLVDREVHVSGSGVGQIFVDTQRAVYEGTKLLLDRGCTRIAFLSALYRGDPEGDRFFGYRRALEERGLPVEQSRVYLSMYNVETGYEGVSRVLDGGSVDGVVCGNDLIAVGAMKRLKELGLGIPEDVKVMGLDDIYLSQFLDPPLSTMRQPAYQMGLEAAKMLIEKIEHDTPLYRRELPFQLVLRGTV